MDSDESIAAAKAAAQIAKWGNLGRPAPKVPPEGQTTLAEDDSAFIRRLGELDIGQLPEVAILPRNFDSAPSIEAFVFERETNDLRVIGRQVGIAVAPLVDKPSIIHENDILTVGAVIVIALKVLEAANSTATLVEFFQRLGKFLAGRTVNPPRSSVEVVQEIIVTNGATARRVTYRGPANELHTVVDALKEDRCRAW